MDNRVGFTILDSITKKVNPEPKNSPGLIVFYRYWFGLDASEIFPGAGINANGITLFDKIRHLDRNAGLHLDFFRHAGGRITTDKRLLP